jgi:uncharacterized protein
MASRLSRAMTPPSRLALTAILVAFVGCVPATSAIAQDLPPELTAPVNDFANVIGAENERALERLSGALLAASGDTLVVATVPTFQPYPDLPSYAVRMFENRGRGIGQKGKDNGLLIVLAVKDRAVRVEVGYDLEGVVTDGFAGETSRELMVPFFRNGDYGGGLLAGATRLAQRIAQARNVTLDNVPQPSAPIGGPSMDIPWVFVAIIVFLILRAMRGPPRRRRRGRWVSHAGPFGAGYGGWNTGSWHSGGGGFGGGFGGFGGGRSGGGGGGASW